MRSFLTSIILLASLSLNAETVKLAVITSGFDQDVMDFFVEIDDQSEIDSIRYITTMPDGGIFADVTLPAVQVINDGAVIVERNGHQAVKLELEDFNLSTGGIVKLNYLYSGITGARYVKRLALRFDNGAFALFDSKDRKLNRLYLVPNWVRFVGIVGIREIKTSYQE